MFRACGTVLVLLLALGRASEVATPHNILLLTIDTLRADRVGRAGVTPTLDALAARGTRFTRAYAHAPTTLPSHASILTGLLPASHGARNNGGFRLAASSTTLAELLHGTGYATGAFVSAFVLDSRYGLGQGFDVYDDRTAPAPRSAGAGFRFAERRATDTLGPAAAWIRKQSGPWFAWVHLFDPHAPYQAPGDSSRDGPENPSRAYDHEVAYVDRSLARFFADVRTVLAQTLVIVTADHGESLGEHGESTHGLFAYDATLRVPLIVAGPGVPARVAPEAVAHVDIMPTVLDLVGVSAVVDGRSLVGALKGNALSDRPIYFEALDASLTRGWAPLTGVIGEGWKYIDLPLPELYDLEADSGERTNRVQEDTARASRMRDLARRLGTVVNRPPNTAVLVDPDAQARLRSLGYVGGAATRRSAWRPEDDPKRLLPLHTRFQRAADVALPDPDAAIREFRALIAERPEFAAAYEAAAALLVESGRPREAVALLSQARSRGLSQRALTERLGAALLAAGEVPAAVALLEKAATLEPDALEVRHVLALALVAAGDQARARDALTAILQVDPTAPDVWSNLGTLDLQRGAMRAAEHAFERALDGDEGSVAAWKGLGAAVADADPARAAAAWQRALSLAPTDYPLLARLAFHLATSNPGRARPYLERLIREAPEARFKAEKQRARALLAR